MAAVDLPRARRASPGSTGGWIDGPPPPKGRRKIAPADWGAEASRSQVSTKLNVWCLAFWPGCLFAVETGAGAGRCRWRCPPNRLHVLRLAVPSSRGSLKPGSEFGSPNEQKWPLRRLAGGSLWQFRMDNSVFVAEKDVSSILYSVCGTRL